MGNSYAMPVVGGVTDVPLAQRGDDGRIEPGRSLLPLKLFGRAVCLHHPTHPPMQHRMSCPLLGPGVQRRLRGPGLCSGDAELRNRLCRLRRLVRNRHVAKLHVCESLLLISFVAAEFGLAQLFDLPRRRTALQGRRHRPGLRSGGSRGATDRIDGRAAGRRAWELEDFLILGLAPHRLLRGRFGTVLRRHVQRKCSPRACASTSQPPCVLARPKTYAQSMLLPKDKAQKMIPAPRHRLLSFYELPLLLRQCPRTCNMPETYAQSMVPASRHRP
jgi:hypothetical protein